MALHTFGTTSTTRLNAVTFEPSSVLSASDLAAIAAAITDDARFAVNNPNGILATGTTHSNTTLDTLVATAGGGLAGIRIGMLVLGNGIVPGTFVTAIPTSTSVTLSQAATAGASGTRVGFVPANPAGIGFEGQLVVPNRGILKVLPGDIVAVDNTGWPVLVSGAGKGYAGTNWTYT